MLERLLKWIYWSGRGMLLEWIKQSWLRKFLKVNKKLRETRAAGRFREWFMREEIEEIVAKVK
jgi:hypothetical protein